MAFELAQQAPVSIRLTTNGFSGTLGLLGADCDGQPFCAMGAGDSLDTLLPAGVHVVVVKGTTVDDEGPFSLDVSVR